MKMVASRMALGLTLLMVLPLSAVDDDTEALRRGGIVMANAATPSGSHHGPDYPSPAKVHAAEGGGGERDAMEDVRQVRPQHEQDADKEDPLHEQIDEVDSSHQDSMNQNPPSSQDGSEQDEAETTSSTSTENSPQSSSSSSHNTQESPQVPSESVDDTMNKDLNSPDIKDDSAKQQQHLPNDNEDQPESQQQHAQQTTQPNNDVNEPHQPPQSTHETRKQNQETLTSQETEQASAINDNTVDGQAHEADASQDTNPQEDHIKQQDEKQQSQQTQQQADSQDNNHTNAPDNTNSNQPHKQQQQQQQQQKSEEDENEEEEEDEDDQPIKAAVNYAHKSAGAIILSSSTTFKGTSNLLVSDNDKYAIAPCADAKKSVVIGLSEDILVKQVVLSNYEKYSSSVHEFQILATQSLDDAASASGSGKHHQKNWADLGTYYADASKQQQTFDLLEPSWARYLKFRFLTHHGVEHYCTITQIKVHGSTMLQGFHEQWKESEKEAEERLRTVEGDKNAGNEGREEAGAGEVASSDAVDTDKIKKTETDEAAELIEEDKSAEEPDQVDGDNASGDVDTDASKNNKKETSQSANIDDATHQETGSDESAPKTHTDQEKTNEEASDDTSPKQDHTTEAQESSSPKAPHTNSAHGEGTTASSAAQATPMPNTAKEMPEEPPPAKGEDKVHVDTPSTNQADTPQESYKKVSKTEHESSEKGDSGESNVDEEEQEDVVESRNTAATAKEESRMKQDLSSSSDGQDAPPTASSTTSTTVDDNDQVHEEAAPSQTQDAASLQTNATAEVANATWSVESAEELKEVVTDAVKKITTMLKEKMAPASEEAKDNLNGSGEEDMMDSEGGEEGTTKHVEEGEHEGVRGDETAKNRLQDGTVHTQETSNKVEEKGSSETLGSMDEQEAVSDTMSSSSDSKAQSDGSSDETKKSNSSAAEMEGEAAKEPNEEEKQPTQTTTKSPPPSTTSKKPVVKDTTVKAETSGSSGNGGGTISMEDMDLGKIPALSCLESMNFNEFKAKVLARGPASSSSSSSQKAAPVKMEPIFKTLTDEIKALQMNLSIYDQYIKAMSACYQQIIVQLADENRKLETVHSARLASIEEELRAMRELQANRFQMPSIDYMKIILATYLTLQSMLQTIWRFFLEHGLPLLDYMLTDDEGILLFMVVFVAFMALGVIFSRHRLGQSGEDDEIEEMQDEAEGVKVPDLVLDRKWRRKAKDVKNYSGDELPPALHGEDTNEEASSLSSDSD